MANTVYEWYGFLASDGSSAAAHAANLQDCALIGNPCKKKKSGGVCSVVPGVGQHPVIICPHRLYADNHRVLALIAMDAFGDLNPHLDPTGLPSLVRGSKARSSAAGTGQVQIGVFGQGFDGEVKLPPTNAGLGSYSIDFILFAVDQSGGLLAFSPVEVQSIDISGSNADSVKELKNGRQIVAAQDAGLNWENVNKRILPQLIVKGLMLQAERLCRRGMYFVTPQPVYDRIMLRLGGNTRLRDLPQQPGSITFVPYDYNLPAYVAGSPVPLKQGTRRTVSTSDLSIAFITPENLPPAGSYEDRILAKL